MGYIKHHSIVVTSSIEKVLKGAQHKAKTIFGNQVSEIIESPLNSYKSFLVAPDGSKEGWNDSVIGDEQREKFIKYLNAQAYEDGSSSLKYVEVSFGEDNEMAAEVISYN